VTELSGLTQAITEQLRTYTEDFKKEVQKASNEIAKELVKDLNRDSPKKTGDYEKGWRIKKKGKLKNVVHNKTDYQLTHLLEKGHAIKRGGRVIGKSDPIIHIAQNEEKAINKFYEAIERAIRQ
jgi:hypothetical protein